MLLVLVVVVVSRVVVVIIVVKEVVMGLVIIVLLVEMGLWSRKKRENRQFKFKNQQISVHFLEKCVKRKTDYLPVRTYPGQNNVNSTLHYAVVCSKTIKMLDSFSCSKA